MTIDAKPGRRREPLPLPSDWLGMALAHHVEIEEAFAAVKEARTGATRVAALKKLAIVLTGHANAEESVLYPGLARAGERHHATTVYAEQAAAKIEMGVLETYLR
jgi:hypothetical protein